MELADCFHKSAMIPYMKILLWRNKQTNSKGFIPHYTKDKILLSDVITLDETSILQLHFNKQAFHGVPEYYGKL
jgi:hypothetical protein